MYKMRITTLRSGDRNHYQRFLFANKHSLIYSSVEFRNFLREVVKGEIIHYLAWRGDTLCGVLPVSYVEHPDYGKVINSLPWYGSYGGCTLSGSDDGDARKILLQKYAELLDDPSVFSATLILSPFENDYLSEYEEILRPPFSDRRIGQITALPPYSDTAQAELMQIIRQKTRNLVRKSLQQGFSSRVTDEDWAWEFLHRTHMENIGAVGGKAKPWKHFEAMRRNIPVEWRRLYVAQLNDVAVAAVLLFRFNQTVEYITPVIKLEYRPLQPLSFLIYGAMLDSIEAGYQYWNWGGTWVTQQSLHHFKAGWGARDYPYTYLIHASQDSVDRIRQNAVGISGCFPWHYLFPFDQLS